MYTTKAEQKINLLMSLVMPDKSRTYLLRVYIGVVIFISIGPMHLILPEFSESEPWHHLLLQYFPPDKIVHLAMYLVLSTLLTLNQSFNKKTFYQVLGFAAVMEIVQLWIPYRSFDWVDLLANELGALIPYLLARLRK
jgi:hypothetical protein